MRLKGEKHIKVLVQCKYFTYFKVREVPDLFILKYLVSCHYAKIRN